MAALPERPFLSHSCWPRQDLPRYHRACIPARLARMPGGRWAQARPVGHSRSRAGLGAGGSKTPPHKPCGKWSKTQLLLAPWSMAICWSCKQPAAGAGFGVQDVTPALGHLLALTDTRPCAPLGSSAKDGRARLSLLLRANYPPISLGKDSVDVCKISIH